MTMGTGIGMIPGWSVRAQRLRTLAEQDMMNKLDPGGSGPPPPPGSTNAMTRKWVDVTWQYGEPEPLGGCTGFEVAIYAGDDIEADEAQLAEPLAYVPDPEARRRASVLELRTRIDLRAAVRACYGDFRSGWANADLAAAFVPDVQEYSDAGWLELGNGVIMQWIRTPDIGSVNDAYPVTWPRRFPNECYCASVSTECSAPHDLTMTGFMLISKTAAGCRVWRQAHGSSPVALHAHIIAFGH